MSNDGNQPKPVRVVYYLDIISSWCLWAEPAWAEIQEIYAGRVDFSWRIALMDRSGLPLSRSQCEWFYKRSGTLVRSPFMLNSAWMDTSLDEFLAPNAVAVAAKEFGFTDDRVRLALAREGLIHGRRIGDLAECVSIVSQAFGLDSAALQEKAQSEGVEKSMRTSTMEYHDFKMTQRPSFLLENVIGDRVILSGTYRLEPMAAVIESLLADSADYAAYAAHHGSPPKQ